MKTNDNFLCLNKYNLEESEHKNPELYGQHTEMPSRRLVISVEPCDPIQDPIGEAKCSVTDMLDATLNARLELTR